MAHQFLATNAPSKPNVLESLADGISHVLARPILIAIPLLLDAALVLSPGISGASLGESVSTRLAGQDLTAFQQFGAWLGRQGDWSIDRATALLVPSVIDGMARDDRYAPFTAELFQVNAALGALLLVTGVLFSALLFMGFETWIAAGSGLLEHRETSWPRTIGRAWLTYLGFIALMAVLLSLIIGGMLAPALIAGGGGPDGDVVLAVASLAGLAVLIGTMFVPEAIVLDRTGPFGAIRKSITVVATNFWQAMAFFLVSLLLTPGLLAIWETIAFDPIGLVIAIVLNAGMVTSLAIASLGFYRARSEGSSTV